MSDLKEIIKHIGTIVEHSEADLRTAAKKEEHTPAEIECVKNIAKLAYYYQILKAMDESEEGDNYETGSYQRGRSYNNYRGYNDGGSYGRRRRDSMGRYMDGRYMTDGRYMDAHRDQIMDTLESLMHSSQDERERSAISDCMAQLERM